MTPFLVGIAGGSGSGKTALAAGLADALSRDRAAVLAHDAYYRDRRDLLPSERARLNYDVPEAVDRELFRAHVAALRRGERIVPPRYSFVTHGRDGTGEPVEPRPVVLVEGILLFHDPEVRTALDLRIFLDAPETIRLARRLRRDTAERGRSEASVLAQWRGTVSPAHARYVEPARAGADLVLVTTGPLTALVEVAGSVLAARLARRAAEGAVAA
jgi:uridine kinase